ncbi:hypothetical protein PM082_021927 [Marasmius tenuissimus]|nr:hypothetical protein PM082_021927 [Marasmius tenuissimus]
MWNISTLGADPMGNAFRVIMLHDGDMGHSLWGTPTFGQFFGRLYISYCWRQHSDISDGFWLVFRYPTASTGFENLMVDFIAGTIGIWTRLACATRGQILPTLKSVAEGKSDSRNYPTKVASPLKPVRRSKVGFGRESLFDSNQLRRFNNSSASQVSVADKQCKVKSFSKPIICFGSIISLEHSLTFFSSGSLLSMTLQ